MDPYKGEVICMKKKSILLSVSILLVLFLLIWAKPLLTQEKNTISVLSGVLKLAGSDQEFVKYDEDTGLLYYISETEANENLLTSLPVLTGYELSDQMGSGYLFTQKENPENQVIVSGTQFSRCYRLWKIPRR